MVCLQNDIQNTNRNKQTGIQFSSVTQSYPTLRPHAHQASLSITNSRSLPKLMSIKLVIQSNHLILCRSLPLRPSIFPNTRVFSNESVLHIRWPKYWSFSFNITTIAMHLKNKISSQRIQNKNHIHTIHIKVKSNKTNLLIYCLAKGQ